MRFIFLIIFGLTSHTTSITIKDNMNDYFLNIIAFFLNSFKYIAINYNLLLNNNIYQYYNIIKTVYLHFF